MGNFAARLLVRLFSNSSPPRTCGCSTTTLGRATRSSWTLHAAAHPPLREAVYPVEKMEEVWHYECIPSIGRPCRRPNRKKCDILKKAKKVEK